MEKDELAKWMKEHGVDAKMRTWLANDIVGSNDYTILEDLAIGGTATVSISLNAYGNLEFTKMEPIPIPEPEVAPIEPEETPVLPMAEPEESPKRKSRKKTT